MQKIPTLFMRDGKPFRASRAGNPKCQWVLDGEGVATEKFDGTACLVRGATLYRRHRVKEGKGVPPGWLHWSGDAAQMSGHGWVPVGDGAADQYHREAAMAGPHGDYRVSYLADGTYELVGPMVQGNPQGLGSHDLWRHGSGDAYGLHGPRTFAGIRESLLSRHVEGIVYHHPDGRMAKIKRSDFGLPWP